MSVAGRVESHHRKLVSSIRTISDISSASVLTIGNTLVEVVDCAMEIKSLVDRLGESGAPTTSAEALARPAEVFTRAVHEGLGHSRGLLDQAAARAGKVGDACEELLRVTGMCRTLVMHTRIESARLGARRGGISATG